MNSSGVIPSFSYLHISQMLGQSSFTRTLRFILSSPFSLLILRYRASSSQHEPSTWSLCPIPFCSITFTTRTGAMPYSVKPKRYPCFMRDYMVTIGKFGNLVCPSVGGGFFVCFLFFICYLRLMIYI